VAKSNTLAELRGWTRYVGLQIEYSLLERTVERELVPMTKDQQMTVLAWSPLRKGVLYWQIPAGKSETIQGGRRTDAHRDDEGIRLCGGSDPRGCPGGGRGRQGTGVPAAQVALAWLRYCPACR